jgi:hypothetical protein
LDRSEEQRRENLGSEEEYHPLANHPFNFERNPDKRKFRVFVFKKMANGRAPGTSVRRVGHSRAPDRITVRDVAGHTVRRRQTQARKEIMILIQENVSREILHHATIEARGGAGNDSKKVAGGWVFSFKRRRRALMNVIFVPEAVGRPRSRGRRVKPYRSAHF